MKVLQVNSVYNYGSTGKIVYDLHQGLLKNGHQSVVCYGRGAEINDEGVVRICTELYSKLNNLRSRITGMMYGGFELSTKKLKEIIRKEKPDVVHLQCLNCFFLNIYEIVDWLKKNHINTVVTLHAEFMYTANCGYALSCEKWRTGCGSCPRLRKETRSWFFDRTHRSFQKMKDAFDGFHDNLITVSVSPWLKNRAEQSPILQGKQHVVIYNGIDTSVFCPNSAEELKEKYQLAGKKVLFHVTAKFSDDPSHIKGGVHIIELAQRMKECVFLVAGKTDIHGQLPENIILLGSITNQSVLAQYYSLADATILTSKKETFSMPCAESLCCGTPIIGFEAGAPEMIALEQYSRFVKQGDLDALESAVRDYLAAQPFNKQTVGSAAKAVYSKEAMLQNYLQIYQQLCKE